MPRRDETDEQREDSKKVASEWNIRTGLGAKVEANGHGLLAFTSPVGRVVA